jgi:hypothetical protein
MAIRLALLAVVAGALLGATAAQAAGPRSANGRLAAMVLPRSQLGATARGLDVKIGSGVQSNAAAAEDTLDPMDTAEQLARGGRVTGYSLEYDELAFERLRRGKGVLSIGSSVDLFTTAAAAERYIAKQLADGRKYDGRYVEAGLRLTDWRTSPVRGLGGGAVLIREALRLGDARFSGTVVVFRTGKLMGSVGVTRADARSDVAYTVRLARQLARRMNGGGSGGLGLQPVFVPQTARKGKPAAGGPDLAPMALAAGDVPKGGQMVTDAYVANRTALAKYVREFDFQDATLGGAGLFSVESEVNLLRSAGEASGVMVRLRALYGSPDVARAFTEGFQVSGVEVELRKSVNAGDEALVLVLTFEVKGRRAHIAQFAVRVGRVVGLLNVGAIGPSFDAAAAEPFAVRLGRRIQAGL